MFKVHLRYVKPFKSYILSHKIAYIYFFLLTAFLKFGVPAVPENVKVFDESGTEVDGDVFEDIVRDPSVGVLTIKHGAGLYLFHYMFGMYLILLIYNNSP